MKKNSFSYYLEMADKIRELPQWENAEVQKFKSDIKTEFESIANNNEIENFKKKFEIKWNGDLNKNEIKKEPLEIITDKNQWYIKIHGIPSSVSEGKSHYMNAKGNVSGADFTKYNSLFKKEDKTQEDNIFIKEFPERQKADYVDAKRRHILLMGLIQAVLEIQKEKKSFWIQLEDYNKYSGEQATFKITKFPEQK